MIGRIEIENRRNASFYSRSKGLTVWVSDDGQQWTRLWRIKSLQASDQLELTDPVPAQFVKIGLERKGILHLNHVSIFGQPLISSEDQ